MVVTATVFVASGLVALLIGDPVEAEINKAWVNKECKVEVEFTLDTRYANEKAVAYLFTPEIYRDILVDTKAVTLRSCDRVTNLCEYNAELGVKVSGNINIQGVPEEGDLMQVRVASSNWGGSKFSNWRTVKYVVKKQAPCC